MKIRLIGFALCLLLCFSLFTGCANSASYNLSYYDELDAEKGYDKNLFYLNDMSVAGADPCVIEITDKEDPYYGWFYLYYTGSTIFTAYRSKDMQTWQSVGPIFRSDEESRAKTSMWAPECIYDEKTDKYYLFFSAADYYSDANYFPGRNPLGFKNYEDKNRYLFYQDYVFSRWEDVDTPSEKQLSALKEELETRVALIKASGANTLISDGIDGGYSGKYSQANIEKIVSEYKTIDFGTTLKASLYKKMRSALLTAYTANIYSYSNSLNHAIFLAVSDKPEGPFVQYTNEVGKVNEGTGEEYNSNNRIIDLTMPFIAGEDVYKWLMEYRSPYYVGIKEDYYVDENGEKQPGQMLSEGSGRLLAETSMEMIDVSPFVDPKTGEKYLYMIRGPHLGSYGFIFVIKMGEKWTDDPKWETTTRLTRTKYYSTDSIEKSNYSDDNLGEGSTNEGPYMYYNARNDKYYLTLSINNYNSPAYAVIQAIGDTPFGPFRKLTREEGGVMLSSSWWDHVSGPGHHSFITYKEQLYMVYHNHYDTVSGTGARGTCVDAVTFANNGNEEILHLNGPTYAYMPKIGPDMPYRNIAGEASIKASNVKDDSSVTYLNDGNIRFYQWDDFISEFETSSNSSEIVLSFNEYRTITALMIFNSYDYAKHFENDLDVELHFRRKLKNGKVEKGIAHVKDVPFDMNMHANTEYEGSEYMRPGGSSIAQFNEIEVNEIRIKMKESNPFAISEIYVLGK